jgi:hypothetical protein
MQVGKFDAVIIEDPMWALVGDNEPLEGNNPEDLCDVRKPSARHITGPRSRTSLLIYSITKSATSRIVLGRFKNFFGAGRYGEGVAVLKNKNSGDSDRLERKT